MKWKKKPCSKPPTSHKYGKPYFYPINIYGKPYSYRFFLLLPLGHPPGSVAPSLPAPCHRRSSGLVHASPPDSRLRYTVHRWLDLNQNGKLGLSQVGSQSYHMCFFRYLFNGFFFDTEGNHIMWMCATQLNQHFPASNDLRGT